jgi:hypothetical protein
MLALVRGVRVSAAAKALAVFAMGLVTGSMLVGWSPTPAITTGSIDSEFRQVSNRCDGGDEVSSFICRNTWMSQHRYSYR